MKWRIWLLSLCVTFACVFMFGFISTQVYYNSSIERSHEFLMVYMNEFEDGNYSLDEVGVDAYSKKLNGARVTFMDPQGKVLADSMAKGELENHINRAEIQDAIFNGNGFAVRSSTTLGKNMVYYCKNYKTHLVRVAIVADSYLTIFGKILPSFVMFTGVMLALCVVLAFVSTHLVITPVKTLAREAVKSDKVTTKFSELQPVVELLNERSRNIKRQMQELTAEKDLVEKARQSKDEFISNVTHEMNTPLTSIHGYAELLTAGGMTQEQQKTAYKTILTQSERLTNLIACIINYSEIDNDELPSYEVNFSALAKETLSALKPEADKRGIKIIDKISDNVIISSRHERLSEIFGNLVRNAIKYNKDNGSITVTLNYKELIVEDTGIGIAQENMSKIFSRFFTVDKSHGGKNGGFGLGLAVAKKICQKSGWQISVQSTPDIGSTFTVKF